MARRRTLGPALQFFCFSVFGTSKGRFWHVHGHWDQPYRFSVFLFFEGVLLARRRTLGPALKFFVFLFLAHRRGAFGTSTDIGTSLTVFLFFCFSKEYCWHVDGHWDHPYSFSVFGTSKGRSWHVDGHWGQPYSFSWRGIS